MVIKRVISRIAQRAIVTLVYLIGGIFALMPQLGNIYTLIIPAIHAGITDLWGYSQERTVIKCTQSYECNCQVPCDIAAARKANHNFVLSYDVLRC
jgi:hypothetical protein